MLYKFVNCQQFFCENLIRIYDDTLDSEELLSFMVNLERTLEAPKFYFSCYFEQKLVKFFATLVTFLFT